MNHILVKDTYNWKYKVWKEIGVWHSTFNCPGSHQRSALSTYCLFHVSTKRETWPSTLHILLHKLRGESTPKKVQHSRNDEYYYSSKRDVRFCSQHKFLSNHNLFAKWRRFTWIALNTYLIIFSNVVKRRLVGRSSVSGETPISSSICLAAQSFPLMRGL